MPKRKDRIDVEACKLLAPGIEWNEEHAVTRFWHLMFEQSELVFARESNPSGRRNRERVERVVIFRGSYFGQDRNGRLFGPFDSLDATLPHILEMPADGIIVVGDGAISVECTEWTDEELIGRICLGDYYPSEVLINGEPRCTIKLKGALARSLKYAGMPRHEIATHVLGQLSNDQIHDFYISACERADRVAPRQRGKYLRSIVSLILEMQRRKMVLPTETEPQIPPYAISVRTMTQLKLRLLLAARQQESEIFLHDLKIAPPELGSIIWDLVYEFVPDFLVVRAMLRDLFWAHVFHSTEDYEAATSALLVVTAGAATDADQIRALEKALHEDLALKIPDRSISRSWERYREFAATRRQAD